MLTEPNPGQVEAFLDRWGIPYGLSGGEQEEALAGESRIGWGGSAGSTRYISRTTRR